MPSRTVNPAFPERMRELLAASGLSYRALAGRTFHGKTYLHDIATGRKAPTADVARRIDDELGAGGQLADMVTMSPAAATDRIDETGDMQRRTLLAALAGLTVERGAVADLIAAVADHARRGSSVDDWRETAWEAGYAYLTTPRIDLLRDLASDLAAVQVALPTTPASRRPILHDAAARMAALIAMACIDLGHHAEGRATWRMARRHGSEAASVDTNMWVRGQEALTGLYAGRPLPTILDLADRGLALASTPTAGRAVLLAAKAQALAASDRVDDVEPVLDQLRATFDRLPASSAGTNSTIYAWPERRLRHVESFVSTSVGSARQAQRCHDAALALLPDRAVDQRCQIQMHRASRLVRDGYVIEGVEHAAASLENVPVAQRGRYVLALGVAVLDRVPAGAARQPAVDAYRDQLVASGVGGRHD